MTTIFDDRPYQRAAIDAVHQAHAEGMQRPLVALPTGTGKTIVFAHLLAERPGRALVLAHRDELINQAVDKLSQVNPGFDIGVVKAERNEHQAPLVVGSVQTLCRRNRLAQVVPDFETIVVDEAHHATAFTYEFILEYLGAFDAGGPLTLGVTATPERGDRVHLRRIFEEIVYSRGILEMIVEGYLCDLRAIQVQLNTDFNQLRVTAGDYHEGQLADVLKAANTPGVCVQAYQRYAPGRKALVFTPSVELAHLTADACTEAGISSGAIDAHTPLDERRDLLQRFHTGEIMVVANCGVLTEGYDEPSIACIIMARPTRSALLYAQMLGRGTRKYPTKDDCLIIDVVGNTEAHALITVASLFDVKPESLCQRTVSEAVEAEAEACTGPLPYVQKTLDLYAKEVKTLFSRKRLAWVPVRDGIFALSMGQGHCLVLQRGTNDRYAVAQIDMYHPRKAASMLAQGLALDYAQGYAEEVVRRQQVNGLANPHARFWQAPATEKTRGYADMLGIRLLPGATQAQASQAITRQQVTVWLRAQSLMPV